MKAEIGNRKLPLWYNDYLKKNYMLDEKMKASVLFEDMEMIHVMGDLLKKNDLLNQFMEFYGIVLLPNYDAVNYFSNKPFSGVLFNANDNKGCMARIINDAVGDKVCASILNKSVPIDQDCFEDVYICSESVFVENIKNKNSYLFPIYRANDLDKLNFLNRYPLESNVFIIYPEKYVSKQLIQGKVTIQGYVPILTEAQNARFINIFDGSHYHCYKFERT